MHTKCQCWVKGVESVVRRNFKDLHFLLNLSQFPIQFAFSACLVKMRAARYYKHHDVKMEDVEVPKPGPSQVLVAVEWCGICGSDLFDYLNGRDFKPPETFQTRY